MTGSTEAAASQLFREEPTRWIDVGAGEAAIRTVGSGPDVLFVHGWPVSGATFRRLLPHLVDHVTCHVMDFPSTGSSRFGPNTPMSIDQHKETVRRVIDGLGVDEIAVVGHDSGGLITRHAVVGDDRLRALGLINTEQLKANWRFRLFLANRNLPGFGAVLGWAAMQPRVRRNKFVLGDAFVDRSLLDGEFEEFFLRPLHEDKAKLDAGIKLLKSLELADFAAHADIHPKLDVPVALVWGVEDPFFPIEWARDMVSTFPNATLHEIEGAGLFSQEEKPAEVAEALLTVIAG